MSGGVDSSVAAALLAARGYAVIGVTLQLYDHGAATAKKGACCAGQDIHDARRVAATLGIPHYVLDYESRFSQSVIEDFADSYLRGETPVPCIRCNERVKFADLLGTARDLGADCLATGHYVRREIIRGRPVLLRGVDPARDQSYFLFATTAEQLAFLRFPLGGLGKDRVRALAAHFSLAVADKPDSQDICFVPQGRYTDIVARLRPEAMEPGDIVHLDGRRLGRHQGIAHFTVGQRRGLGLGGEPEPLYVVRIDAAERRVVVGPRSALATQALTLRDLNWLDGPLPAGGRAVLVKVRSTRPPVAAHLSGDGSTLRFDRPEFGVSPGQAAVFYEEERVLGGGWIAATQAAWQEAA
ncbi:MAG: tRNA 2-thiouridine(34) synthase MnmA [Alphaproteobacteria bacterium]|nr:MAG: tRNA 2-thiouridine(34) synthase MnmA [Alphaproteobacteria bacterium]